MTPDHDRFPNERPPTVSKGCWIAGAIALALVLLVVGVAFSFYQMKAVRSHHVAEAERMSHTQASMSKVSSSIHSGERSVMIRQEDLASFSATDFGEKLTIENAVAILVDPTSTRLAREAFSKAANGHEIEWVLKVSEISRSKENEILASLLIPYSIESGHSTQSSYVNVEALFSGDSYADLVNVRQGQWIPVRGKLKIDGKDLEIIDPVLVPESQSDPAH